MITESTMYWVLKLDDIIKALGIMVAISIILGSVAIVAWVGLMADEQRELAKYPRRYFFICLAVLISIMVIRPLIPSTRQMAMIKVVPIITNSEIVSEMQGDAKELYRMGIDAIKEQLTNHTRGSE